MKKPEQFTRRFGVLNVGMAIVSSLLIVMGFIGYLKYGDEVQGSLTLNLPQDDMWVYMFAGLNWYHFVFILSLTRLLIFCGLLGWSLLVMVYFKCNCK